MIINGDLENLWDESTADYVNMPSQMLPGDEKDYKT
jgi:hypothetical protein